MRILITLILAISVHLVCISQTLPELESRLDTSEIEYIYQNNNVEVVALNKSEPLPDILCRKKVNNNYQTTYFRLHGENDINFLKAEKDMDTLMFADARKKYLALLDSFPEDTYLMTRVGYSYEKEGNDKKAKSWYQKSLNGNTIAFDTQKRMARILVKDKETRAEALDLIIWASIMNRNDESIEEMLIKVAQANKSKYAGWEFESKAFVSINDKKDRIVMDVSDECWKGYALSQAAYLYEPNFKSEVTKRTDEQLTITPYRESLEILYQNIRKKKVKSPMMKTFKKAVKMGYLEEFMIYEIFLPMDAYTLFSLEEKEKERIFTYVKLFKLGIKK